MRRDFRHLQFSKPGPSFLNRQSWEWRTTTLQVRVMSLPFSRTTIVFSVRSTKTGFSSRASRVGMLAPDSVEYSQLYTNLRPEVKPKDVGVENKALPLVVRIDSKGT